MSDDGAIEAARKHIFGFAEAWTEWEKAMKSFQGSPFRDPTLRARHAALLTKYCTHKRRVYVDCIPAFSPALTYVDVNESTLINTEQPKPSRIHLDFSCRWKYRRFVLLKTAEGWLLDGVKWKVIPTDDWKNGLIGG
jgi:hypothetical protein